MLYKKTCFWSAACTRALSLLLMAGLMASGAQAQEPYLLKEGDQINISVWGEEELNQNTLVLPDGTISFPLAGSLTVTGLPPSEVSANIAQALNDYIPGAVVSVVILATSGNRVFVLGKVRNPGAIVMPGPMTITQALSLSGGLDTFANENGIRILRNGENGQEQLEVKYSQILSGRDLSTNFELKAGDTILIP